MKMKRIVFIMCLLLLVITNVDAQEQTINAEHTFEKNSETNEYKITSVYSDLTGADFVKVRYRIPPGINVISPSLSGSLSKKEEDGVSYYIYSVDKKGFVTTTFYIQPIDEEDITISIGFNYALGDNNTIVDLEDIVISTSNDYVVNTEETPVNNALEISDFEEDSIPSTNINPEIDSSSSNSELPVVHKQENYSIQLLSLSRYSDDRVMKFCFDHNISNGELIKRNVGGVIKISIGRYSTKEAADQAKAIMIENDAVLHDAFIIQLR